MGLKMSGYICDKCRTIIIAPNSIGIELRKLVTIFAVRIYCGKCGTIIERAENYMLLKDAEKLAKKEMAK